MPAKRSNTSPPRIRSPCLAPAHFSDKIRKKKKKKKVKEASNYYFFHLLTFS